MLRDSLLRYIGFAKAISLWMHSAHHLTKGPAFVANHELLFGRVYQTLSEDFDKAVEKLVYLMDDETFACPITISNKRTLTTSCFSVKGEVRNRKSTIPCW